MESRTPSVKRAVSSARKPLQASAAANGPAATLRSATKRPRDAMSAPSSAIKPSRPADLGLSSSAVGHSGADARSNSTLAPSASSATARMPAASMASAQSILTAVRIKPIEPGQTDGFEEDGRGAVVRVKGKSVIEMTGDTTEGGGGGSSSKPVPKAFAPEHVFLAGAGQAEVYEVFAKDIVLAVLGGTNGCLTAYGQTGSGKTHTMLGDPTSPSAQGVIPRALRTLFSGIDALKADTAAASPGAKVEARVKASYVEVYQENVYDLLAKEDGATSGPGWAGAFSGNSGNGAIIPGGPRLLRIRGDDTTGFFLDGVAEVELTDPESALDVLAAGFGARRTTATAMNARSSRSHAILSLIVNVRITHSQGAGGGAGGDAVERVQEREAVLDVVDLAGSERQRDTGAEGSALKEAGKINNSLSHLAEVIKTLLDNSMAKHSKAARPVPWRNSKLTMLLRRSLAGNSRTAMIFTISPAAEYWNESINTLQFADRARKLKTEPSTNERTVLMGGTNAQLAAMNKELAAAHAHIAQLRAALAAGGAGAGGMGMGAGVDSDMSALLGAGGGVDGELPVRALDFGSSTASAGSWEGIIETAGAAGAGAGAMGMGMGMSDVHAEVDILGPLLGPRVNRLLDRVGMSSDGLSIAARKLSSKLSCTPGTAPADVLMQVVTDALVHRAMTAALRAQTVAGATDLAAGLTEVSQHLQALISAHVQPALHAPAPSSSSTQDDDEEEVHRSPKLRKHAEEEDTGSARHRAASDGGSSDGTPRMSAAFDFDRAFLGPMHGDSSASASGMGGAGGSGSAGQGEAEMGLPIRAVLAEMRSSLLAAPTPALSAVATALGMQQPSASGAFHLPVLLHAGEGRQLASLLTSSAEALAETGRCIPTLYGECKKLAGRTLALEETLASGASSRAVSHPPSASSKASSGKGGVTKGMIGKGHAAAAANAGANASASVSAAIMDGPSLVDISMVSASSSCGAGGVDASMEEGMGMGMGGEGAGGGMHRVPSRSSLSMAALGSNRVDAVAMSLKSAAERMEPNAKPRVSHLAPAEIARRAEARVRSSSIASTSSITASRSESMDGSGPRPSDVFGMGMGMGMQSASAGHVQDENMEGMGMGMVMGMGMEGSREHEEDQDGGMDLLPGDDMLAPHERPSVGAADMPMPSSFHSRAHGHGHGHEHEQEEGGSVSQGPHHTEDGVDMMSNSGRHRLPYSLGDGSEDIDGTVSARVSCVSRASTGTDVGTTVSEHIERQNALNASGPLAASGMLYPGALGMGTAMAMAAVPPQPLPALAPVQPIPLPTQYAQQAPVPSTKPVLSLANFVNVAPPAEVKPAPAPVMAKPAAPMNLLKPAAPHPAPAPAPVAHKQSASAAHKPSAPRATTPVTGASAASRRQAAAKPSQSASAAALPAVPIPAPVPAPAAPVAAPVAPALATAAGKGVSLLSSYIRTVDPANKR